MKTGLFDKNNREITIGDKYITNGNPDIIFNVYFKGGAICGGESFEWSEPIGWEIYENELSLETDFSWIEIID